MPKYPGFIGSSDRSQSLTADCEKTMNWYADILPRNAKSQLALMPTPGFEAFVTVPEIGTRALFTMNDRTLAVIATELYDLDATATATARGVVTQDNHPAQIVMNGAAGGQALIASGTNGYCLDLATNTLTTVLTGDAVQVGYLDGYGIAFDTVTSRFRLSDLNDFTTWDPTQFAARSDAPDNWTAMCVNAPDIWLIGSQSGSVWFDAGDFPFPFAPRSGANFKFGTPATWSITTAGDSVLWLSQNVEGAGIVVQARGYTPQPVSTPSVETRIARYQRDFGITDAEAFSYQQEGHTFYVLRFPAAGATEVYDLTTGFWHERGKWIAAQNRWDVWTPRCHTVAFGKHLVGDNSSGQISAMDVTFGSEADGTAIRRQRIAPSLFFENNWFRVSSFDVLLEMGLGTSTGQGQNPMAMLECSNDGGKTYGHEHTGSAGKMGEYSRRLRFNRLGLSRDRVHRLTVSDPVPWRIVDAFVNTDDGQAR